MKPNRDGCHLLYQGISMNRFFGRLGMKEFEKTRIRNWTRSRIRSQDKLSHIHEKPDRMAYRHNDIVSSDLLRTHQSIQVLSIQD